jgi:hypothetical protein
MRKMRFMNENAELLLEIIKEICEIWGKANLYQIYGMAKVKLGWNTSKTRFWLKYLFDKNSIKWNSSNEIVLNI